MVLKVVWGRRGWSGVSAGIGLLVLGVLCVKMPGQILHASGPRPSFQVTTIKPSAFNETRSGMGFTAGGRGFNATNATVRDLIQEAYNVKSANQILGASGWMTTEKFDIEARMDDPTAGQLATLPLEKKIEQTRLMLQSLLEERFALKLSETSKETSLFTLVAVKGGAKLQPTAMAPAGSDGTNSPHPAVGPRLMRKGPGRVEATGVGMPMLTDFLSRQRELGATGGFTVGDLVVDKTGLTGMYDWSLSWSPDDGSSGDRPAENADAPSLFTALQEQLGLRLERGKAEVEVLVIDHVERPTEN